MGDRGGDHYMFGICPGLELLHTLHSAQHLSEFSHRQRDTCIHADLPCSNKNMSKKREPDHIQHEISMAEHIHSSLMFINHS